VGKERRPEAREKKRVREQAHLSALDTLLLNDPAYRKLYEQLGTALTEAETSADQSIAATQTALIDAETALEEMRQSAPQLLDGRRVFRDKDGVVWDETGAQVSEEIAEGILWPERAASYEAFRAQRGYVADLGLHLQDLQRYRDGTLGDIRNRHDDEDNPMTKDEMEDALKEIEAQRPEVPRPPEVGQPQQAQAPKTENLFKTPDLGA